METTNRDSFSTNSSLDGTTSVLDGEVLTKINEGRRFLGVVLGMGKAVKRFARSARNPEIRRTGIEDNSEGLSRSTNGDLTEVLKIKVVFNLHFRVSKQIILVTKELSPEIALSKFKSVEEVKILLSGSCSLLDGHTDNLGSSKSQDNQKD